MADLIDSKRLLGALLAALAFGIFSPPAARGELNVEALRQEGDLVTLEVTTAPFVIKQRYKSMQGPSVAVKINLKSLLSAGGKLQLKEAPPITGGNIAVNSGLPECNAGTELWWFRGAKIEVLQPDSDKPSNPGFMCHFNLDANLSERALFLPSLPRYTIRLLTFTSGMTEFALPQGYGLPVASEETWVFGFQALNHNLDGKHSFRHRVTLYFNRQRELIQPLKPVVWAAPFIAVPIEGDGETASAICSRCEIPKPGLDTPSSNGRYKMTNGLAASGHWVVPPGRSSWSNPAKEYALGFDRDRKLVAAWVHIHPFAETMTLRAYDQGCSTPREIFTSHIQSSKKGVGLVHIDTLSTEKGIPLPASSDYEVEVTYNNTSGKRQDAMATMGLYLTAPEWRMPEWALLKQTGNLFCGVPGKHAPADAAVAKIQSEPTQKALFKRLPPFTGPASVDDKPYRIEMATSKGTIVFRVEPSWAPKTAAALKPLFEKNLYAGRNFFRAEPGFVVQTPEISPESLSSDAERSLLHRLPAEISDGVRHEPGVLSMARWEAFPESATSSFSFVLGTPGYLDGKYTVFAKVENWEESSKIFQSIVDSALANQPAKIISTRLLAN